MKSQCQASKQQKDFLKNTSRPTHIIQKILVEIMLLFMQLSQF